MFWDILFSVIFNYSFYNSLYYSLYNCLLITISSFFKILFYENYLAQSFVYITGLNSIFYYTIDTFSILKSGNLNVFIIHHLFSIYIITSEYAYRPETYIKYILLFLTESSSVCYNLYIKNFISKKTHINYYIPTRFISSFLFIYYMLYEAKYTYQIEFILNTIAYTLLVSFNSGAILKCLNII